MKIKILQEITIYPDGIKPVFCKEGDVLETPDDLALSLISGGLASEVKEEEKPKSSPKANKMTKPEEIKGQNGDN